MYNKYFTMKKSELKEAIKTEIKSVLTEAMSSSAIEKLLSQIEKEKDKPERMKSIIKSLTGLVNRGKYDQIEVLRNVLNKFKDLNIKLNESVLSEDIKVGDIVTLGGDGDELEVIDSREMFGSDMMAYRVKKVDGTKFEIGDETVEYSADQLRPARMMNEGKRGVVVDPDEIMMHINQYQSGNIDGDDLAQAIEEILVAMMNKSVTFSDIREEDEPTAADLKKKDSVATISNKLQKVTAEIKKHLAMYKDAEGDEAKKLAINMLKKLNAEKKKLEKDL